MISTELLIYKAYLKQYWAPRWKSVRFKLTQAFSADIAFNIAVVIMAFLGILVWIAPISVLVLKHLNPTFEISNKLCWIWGGFAVSQMITMMIDIWILFKKEYSDEGFYTDALSNRNYIVLIYGIVAALAIFTVLSILFIFVVPFLYESLIDLARKIRNRFNAFKKFKEKNPELIEKIKIEQEKKRLTKKFKKVSVQLKTKRL